ncbi:RNase E specificity factor CsrD, partial [Salmonella enterica subsp. enterica serovar Infantis]
FYYAVQYKYVSRVQASATAIDTHLVTIDFVSLTPQIDELIIASDIVCVDLFQGESSVYSHSRARGYRPAGSSDMYRELVV